MACEDLKILMQGITKGRLDNGSITLEDMDKKLGQMIVSLKAQYESTGGKFNENDKIHKLDQLVSKFYKFCLLKKKPERPIRLHRGPSENIQCHTVSSSPFIQQGPITSFHRLTDHWHGEDPWESAKGYGKTPESATPTPPTFLPF